MRNNDAYKLFTTYIAIKMHFNGSYDFHKYGGKVKTAGEDAFWQRRDKWHFVKLAKLYTEDQWVDFLVANFIHKQNIWVGDLLDEQANKRFLEFQKRKESRTHIFTTELDSVLAEHSPNELFRTGREYPPIFEAYCHGDVGLDTLVILNRFVFFVNRWDEVKHMRDDPLWEKVSPLIKKYAPFVDYDDKKILEILKVKLRDD